MQFSLLVWRKANQIQCYSSYKRVQMMVQELDDRLLFLLGNYWHIFLIYKFIIYDCILYILCYACSYSIDNLIFRFSSAGDEACH